MANLLPVTPRSGNQLNIPPGEGTGEARGIGSPWDRQVSGIRWKLLYIVRFQSHAPKNAIDVAL
jgi:hypothetical protein